jgi:phage-related protein
MSETFTWSPSYSSSLDREPRILEAAYGDGYAQRTGDGINNAPGTWNLSFDTREQSEISAIDDFLAARGGHEWFYWTPPGKTQGKYVCKAWKASYTGLRNSSLTAVFLQNFTNET